MPSKFACQLTSLALTCVGLSAQQVVPATMNGIEGGSATNVPFGSSLACRYQCIYDVGELGWTGPRLINGISIRADNGSPGTPGSAIAAKGFLVIYVRVSTTYANSAAVSDTFDDNYGEDVRWVITNQPIQLPAQPALPAGPRPANIDLTFTTPWWYGLTPARPNMPPPDSLLIEIQIRSQPSGAYPIDNLGGCIATATNFGNQDPLCTVPGQPPPTLDSDVSMTAGGPFSWYVHNGPANAPFLLAFNMTNQGGLFGDPAYPLPYPMFDPQDPTQPSAALAAMHWPAPDCWLNIDPTTTVFGLCDASGDGVVATQLPPGHGVVGTTLFAQALILAQTANPLRVVTTLGRSSTVCGPLGVSRVFAFYNGSAVPPPLPPTTGSVQYGIGPIIEVW